MTTSSMRWPAHGTEAVSCANSAPGISSRAATTPADARILFPHPALQLFELASGLVFQIGARASAAHRIHLVAQRRVGIQRFSFGRRSDRANIRTRHDGFELRRHLPDVTLGERQLFFLRG